MDVVVVGSANLDIVVPVPHHPVTGETVLGGDHRQVPGGKGANQAIAAARLGRSTGFVGCVGDDAPGATMTNALVGAGVDTGGLIVRADRPTGLAMIAVDASGDNSIVVSPGANADLGPDDVSGSAAVAEAKVVLLQLETPVETVLAAARAANGLVLLNPAPAPSAPLSADLLAEVDVIVPNEIELAMLSGTPLDSLTSIDQIEMAARKLGGEVVVTLGEQGCLVLTDGVATHVPAPIVDPVDTTAAGDSFCGALADALLRGGLVDAARWAVRVGAATTLRHGASSSLPTPDEVEELLTKRSAG